MTDPHRDHHDHGGDAHASHHAGHDHSAHTREGVDAATAVAPTLHADNDHSSHDHAATDHVGHDAHPDHAGHDAHGAHAAHAGHGADHVARFRRLFWINLILAVPVVAFSGMFAMVLGYSLPDAPWVAWVSPLIGTVMYFWGGWPFLTGAVSELRSRKPGMMLLIGLA
ncbi:MAG TPA: heavy metal translocating P-type ATPase, partial [Microbacterium sp.]|nr:heavy metal translocating P-type ATPase [Microbacterium sp.]